MTDGDFATKGTPAATDPQRERRALDLFERYLDIEVAQRDAWLDQQCIGDGELRAAVERLASADAAAENFLTGDYGSSTVRAVIGTSIGPWRLDRLIAEGGMGAVYLAHRDDGAYTQNVAVKLIRPLLLDADAIRRFERERQILAQLQHPNIAQMLDGGTTDSGSPYVVMEFVDGVPITSYCEQHRLGLTQRLDLLRGVCSAVQAAHRNLVVHRDLKPGNILVTADGVPKLLDFGIAKMLQTEQAAVTRVAATTITLTPDYASPEQVRNQLITTSSDVYSLGVVLYEVLAGQRPYSLSGITAAQAEQLICERAPPPPSEALAKSTREGARRARELRGDLDTITMMALRKEPERRYGSVQELSEDIHRYLRGLPINARRDSRLYRIRKFSGRHRWGMVAASLLVLSMIAGIVATSWQAQRAEQQAQRAQQQAARAERQQVKAEKIGEFFRNILMSSSSQWMSKIRKGPDVTMAEVLEISAERADKELVNQPEIHADVLDTIAQSLQGMGLYENARDVALRATMVADSQLPPDHHLRADTRYHYAQNLHLKGELDAAAREYQAAIKLADEILPPDAENLALMHNDYSVLLGLTLNIDESLHEQELAIALQKRRSNGKPTPPIAIGTANIGVLKVSMGDLDGAEQALTEALQMYSQFPEKKFAEEAGTLHNRSRVYALRGDFAKADTDAIEAVRLGREAYGEDHPNFALMLLRKAEADIGLGNYAEAEKELGDGQTIIAKHIDAAHPYNARFQVGFGELYLSKKEYGKAQEVLGRAVASIDKADAVRKYPDHVLARALRLLGSAELGLKRPQRAVDLLQRSLTMNTTLFGADGYETRQSQQVLDEATAAVAGLKTMN